MGLRFCNTTTTARDRRVAKAKGLSANDAGADCYLFVAGRSTHNNYYYIIRVSRGSSVPRLRIGIISRLIESRTFLRPLYASIRNYPADQAPPDIYGIENERSKSIRGTVHRLASVRFVDLSTFFAPVSCPASLQILVYSRTIVSKTVRRWPDSKLKS